MGSKEEYIAKLEAQLQEMSTKIDELKVQANLAKAEARDEFNRQIEIFRQRQSTALNKLDELRNSGGEVWDELKFGIDSAFDDMKKAMKNALDKLK